MHPTEVQISTATQIALQASLFFGLMAMPAHKVQCMTKSLCFNSAASVSIIELSTSVTLLLCMPLALPACSLCFSIADM